MSASRTRPRQRRILVTDARILLVDAGVVLLTVLALVRALPWFPVFSLTMILTLFGAWLSVAIVRQRARLRRQAAAVPDAPARRLETIPLPSPAAAALIARLGRLGLQTAGAIETVLPEREPFRSWILVEPDGETWAEVGESVRPLVVFLSDTPGGRLVEASWPAGLRIDEPELLAARASATPELTLADHRARVAAERRSEAALGIPLDDPDRPDGWRVRSFEDYLAWEPRQRARTGGTRIRTLLRTRIQPLLELAVGMAIIGTACSAALVLAR